VKKERTFSSGKTADIEAPEPSACTAKFLHHPIYYTAQVAHGLGEIVVRHQGSNGTLRVKRHGHCAPDAACIIFITVYANDLQKRG